MMTQPQNNQDLLTLPIGPLTVQPLQADHGASLAIVHPKRGVIAVIEPLNAEDKPDMSNAKREPWDEGYARLFSAAPDLLSALEDAFSDLNLYWRGDFKNRALALKMKAAILLATGKESAL